ncbi:MAG: hypothetical protein EXR75_05340 [Myxococcales bacterium]|nr:hypothetical protein [Myxococcales bacterium]
MAKRVRQALNDQVAELQAPGLMVLLYAPPAASDLRDGKSYATFFPDGHDLVDKLNSGEFAAVGVRWPRADYLLAFSATLDRTVIARASDHVRLGMRVTGNTVCVRGSDDLFCWSDCPHEQRIRVADGLYEVTACMVPSPEHSLVRIFFHFALVAALPDLGYMSVPELFGEASLT